MTTEELLDEVNRRTQKDEEEEEEEEDDYEDEEDRIYRKLAPLEDAFDLALSESRKEMDELMKEYKQLENRAVAIAEKYGVPISFNASKYVPNTIEKWEDRSKYSDEELEVFIENNVHSCYGKVL